MSRRRHILRLTRASLAEGACVLKARDPRLGTWMDRVGPVPLRRQRHRFGALCRSIIAQQVSNQAARAIQARFLAEFAPARSPHPERLLEMDTATLRACGLSHRKIGYLRALAEEFAHGSLRRRKLDTLADDEVIAALTQLPGIGRWTAEMFLIFALGRRDVFSVRDRALRTGVIRVAGRTLTPARIEARAERWAPYRSVASLYLWRIAHHRER